jgi:transcriptional regulator with XRE-family HTH domain
MNITINRRKGDNPLAKLFAETSSVESEAEYKKLMIMEEILRLMKEQGVNRSELATRMGVNPSRITAMMSGANNFTIETLVRSGRALGAELHLHFAPVGHAAHFGSCDRDEIHDAFKVRAVPVEVSRVGFNLGSTASDDNADAA